MLLLLLLLFVSLLSLFLVVVVVKRSSRNEVAVVVLQRLPERELAKTNDEKYVKPARLRGLHHTFYVAVTYIF